MVKIITISLALGVLFLTGCAQKNSDIEVKEKQIQRVKVNNLSSEDERKIMYKGDYNIQYKEPRVVWFKPMLTGKGNIVSERTLALAPKDLRWSNDEEKTAVGEKFKELVKEQ